MSVHLTCRDSEPRREPSDPAEPAIEPSGQIASTAAEPHGALAVPSPLENAAKQDLETMQEAGEEVSPLEQAEQGPGSSNTAVSGQLDKVEDAATEPMQS